MAVRSRDGLALEALLPLTLAPVLEGLAGGCTMLLVPQSPPPPTAAPQWQSSPGKGCRAADCRCGTSDSPPGHGRGCSRS